MPSPATGPAASADTIADMFLFVQAKRAGVIKGDVTAADHVDQIRLVSWRWGLSASSALGNTQAGARRSYTALTVVKRIDPATTALMSVLATNDEVKEARLGMRRPKGQQEDFFTVTLEAARVTGIEHATSPEGEALETVSISFTKVKVEFTPFTPSSKRGGATTFADELPRKD